MNTLRQKMKKEAPLRAVAQILSLCDLNHIIGDFETFAVIYTP